MVLIFNYFNTSSDSKFMAKQQGQGDFHNKIQFVMMSDKITSNNLDLQIICYGWNGNARMFIIVVY